MNNSYIYIAIFVIIFIIIIAVVVIWFMLKPAALNASCDFHPCDTNLTCVDGTCKSNIGQSCSVLSDCVPSANSCVNGVCSTSSPASLNRLNQFVIAPQIANRKLFEREGSNLRGSNKEINSKDNLGLTSAVKPNLSLPPLEPSKNPFSPMALDETETMEEDKKVKKDNNLKKLAGSSASSNSSNSSSISSESSELSSITSSDYSSSASSASIYIPKFSKKNPKNLRYFSKVKIPEKNHENNKDPSPPLSPISSPIRTSKIIDKENKTELLKISEKIVQVVNWRNSLILLSANNDLIIELNHNQYDYICHNIIKKIDKLIIWEDNLYLLSEQKLYQIKNIEENENEKNNLSLTLQNWEKVDWVDFPIRNYAVVDDILELENDKLSVYLYQMIDHKAIRTGRQKYITNVNYESPYMIV